MSAGGEPSGRRFAPIELRGFDYSSSMPVGLGEPRWKLQFKLSASPPADWVECFKSALPLTGDVAQATVRGTAIVVESELTEATTRIRDALRLAVTIANEEYERAREERSSEADRRARGDR